MLAKISRLTTAEFQIVFETGRRSHTPLFQLITLEGQVTAKCAVVVSKKLIKTAVGRNRMRRQIYAMLHNNCYLTSFPERQTILVVKKDALTQTPAALQEALKQTLFP